MRKAIAQKLLQVKAKRIKRRRGVVNFSTAKMALLVYNATLPEVETEVRDYARFLKEEGIKADTIGFYQSKNKEDLRPKDELGYYYFDKKSLNLLGFPKDNRLIKLISSEYHLLVDLNFANHFSLELITTLSKANFKVGLAEGYKNEVCDLTIALEGKNLNEYLKQVTNYLKMLNKK